MATYWENSCSFGLRYVSWYKYLIVSLVFSHLGFWSGNLFLIAPFPDLCLLVPLHGCIQDFCEGGSNLVNGSSFSTFHHNFLKFPYENEMIGCKWGSSVPHLHVHLTVFIVKHVLYKTLSL